MGGIAFRPTVVMWFGPFPMALTGLAGRRNTEDQGSAVPLAPTKNFTSILWARGMPCAPAVVAQKSDAAWRDVAVNVITPAQEDDAVTGRV